MPKYNGWSNYETWCVNLWLSNDAGSVDYWDEQALALLKVAKTRDSITAKEVAIYELGHAIKEQIEESNPLTLEVNEASMYVDLLGAAISSVNWYEVAGHIIENAEELAEA